MRLNSLLFIIPCCFIIAACNNSKKRTSEVPPPVILTIDEMQGQKIDVLMKHFGLPDSIGSKANFQLKASGIEDTVVFSYKTLGRNIFVHEDCTIVLVSYTKEFLMDPKNAQSIEEREKSMEALEK